MAKYYIDGTAGSDAVTLANNSALTPWKTLTRWKSQVLDAGLMTTADEVVVSGLVREPDGVVLDVKTYAAGSRYMKGIRQWRWEDGAVGTVGTQVEQANSILPARFTSAIAVATASVCTNVASIGTLTPTTFTPTHSAPASNGVGYFTYRYYQNVDKFGRHYGHFLRKTSGVVASAGTQEFNWDGTSFTFDGTNVATSPTATDFEFTTNALANCGAIILFQHWEGQGKDGAPALLDGIMFDRAIDTANGAYLASMESCTGAGFRNCIGYDGGHHLFGITGAGNIGCWLDNVVGRGGYGIGAVGTVAGLQGGNSMTCSAPYAVVNDWVWTAATKTLSLSGTALLQQMPPVGTMIEVTSGTGTTAGQLTAVTGWTYTASGTVQTITVADSIAASNATNIRFTIRNSCRDHRVSNFEYHIYPPLGLILSSGAATAVVSKWGIGLSNGAATGASNGTFTGNRYSTGTVTFYPETQVNATGDINTLTVPLSATNRANGWASDIYNSDTFPLIVEDVNFIDVQAINSQLFRDVAFRRCKFNTWPSVISNSTPGQFNFQANASGSSQQISRPLWENCEFRFNVSGCTAATAEIGYTSNTTGNNQTGWTYNAAAKTLTKAAGMAGSAPLPPAGTIITINAYTGYGSAADNQAATVAASAITYGATTTTITLTAALATVSDGDTAVGFSLTMCENRFVNSSYVVVGLNRGPTPLGTNLATVRLFNLGGSARLIGPYIEMKNCVVGLERTVSSIAVRMIQGDDNHGDGSSVGNRRKFSGNVYTNVGTQQSTASGFTTTVTFLDRSTGVDRTGWAETGVVFMSPTTNARLNFAGHAYKTPPPYPGGFSVGSGVNQNENSGQVGGWQYGPSTLLRGTLIRDRRR